MNSDSTAGGGPGGGDPDSGRMKENGTFVVTGVYGVTAYTIQMRAHEIGVRLALGADSRTVRNMIIGQGMSVVLAGIFVGVASAFGLAWVLDGLLFGVTAHDPLVFICAPLVLTGIAFLAVWLPSRLACHVNPVVMLRSE